MQQQQTQPLFISLDEHARLLGRNLSTVRNQAASGLWPVPTVRMGGRRMVPMAAHEEYVSQLLAQMQIEQPQPQAAAEPTEGEAAAPSPSGAKPKRGPGRPRQGAAK